MAILGICIGGGLIEALAFLFVWSACKRAADADQIMENYKRKD